MTDCTFNRSSVTAVDVVDGVLWITNSQFQGTFGGVGGTSSSVRVENCDFSSVVGVGVSNSVANILDSRFVDTAAVSASEGIVVLRNLEIRGGLGLVSSFASVLVSNCLIAGAPLNNGIHFSDGRLIVENSTIIDNLGPGIDIGSGTLEVVLRNSILWGNFPDFRGTTEIGQLRFNENDGIVITIENSIIEGWTGKLGGTGNSGLDPMFIDRIGPDGIPRTGDGDY